jgi:hypothetical protein
MELPVEITVPLTSSIPEVAFVLELGYSMQAFGASATTLEKALGRVAQHLELEGAVFATPTGFLASLRKEGLHSKTYLMRLNTGWSSLEKLADVEALVDLVLSGQLDAAAARQHLAAPVRLLAQGGRPRAGGHGHGLHLRRRLARGAAGSGGGPAGGVCRAAGPEAP